MKTQISSLALVAAILAGATACSPQSESLFDRSPSERMQQGLSEAQQALISAEFGWQMHIFPGENQPYGGYTVLAKFTDNGIVEATSELNQEGKTYTSSFVVDASSGVTLTFDTKNEAIHLFSEPESTYWIAQGASTSKGADGDFTFQIVRASREQIILRGLRSGVKVMMTPLKSADWGKMLRELKATYVAHTFPFCEVSVGEETARGRMDYTRRQLLFSLSGKTYALPYAYTDKGIRLYQKTSVAGVEVESLELSGQELRTSDGSMTVRPYVVPLANHLLDDVWYVKADRNHYAGRAALGVSRGYTVLAHAPIGLRLCNFATQGESGFGLWSMIDFRPSFGLIPLRLPLEVERLADDRLSFALRIDQIKPETNQEYIINSMAPGLKAFAAPFANVGKVDIGYESIFNEDYAPRTLSLSTDNPLSPSWIKLQDEADAESWIKLVRYP